MPAMEWTDKLALGLGPMDVTHQEFVVHYNGLLPLEGAALLAAMDAFIVHTVEHFDQENRWMEQVGFPACHKAEHDRVLAVMRDVRGRMERGDAALGRQLIRELPLWLENHVATMDAALAAYLESIGFDIETGAITRPQTDPCTGEAREPAADAGGCGGGCGTKAPEAA